jgi:hypothetical protein
MSPSRFCKEALSMANRSNNSAWILVVILAVCLQVVYVFADCRQTATGTAIDFSKAYFLLDADMEKYMCSELAGDADESAAASYLQAMTDEARERGFGTGMVRQSIYHVKTETLAQDAESATIHLKACVEPASILYLPMWPSCSTWARPIRLKKRWNCSKRMANGRSAEPPTACPWMVSLSVSPEYRRREDGSTA